MAPHFSTLAWKIPWMEEPGGAWQAAVHGGRKESDTTEQLHFHFSLSCIGEGNGNPLQYSCLDNPRDEGAWWAAVYEVSQSRTWLKWLSSSSRGIISSLMKWKYQVVPRLWRITSIMKVKVIYSCPTLCDPMGYTVHGILQARILEWVAYPFTRGSSQPRDQTQVSYIASGFFTSWATREAQRCASLTSNQSRATAERAPNPNH